MDQRYATSPDSIPTMDTNDLRDRFLVPDVFTPGSITLTYTHHDRIILGGATPAGNRLTLAAPPELRSEHFLDNRELGIINVGATGTVDAGGEKFQMAKGACLYLGKGTQNISFTDHDEHAPAQFYLFSAPAHTTHPNNLLNPGEGTTRELGDPLTEPSRVWCRFLLS